MSKLAETCDDDDDDDDDSVIVECYVVLCCVMIYDMIWYEFECGLLKYSSNREEETQRVVERSTTTTKGEQYSVV
jgi:hypothetical protein